MNDNSPKNTKAPTLAWFWPVSRGTAAASSSSVTPLRELFLRS